MQSGQPRRVTVPHSDRKRHRANAHNRGCVGGGGEEVKEAFQFKKVNPSGDVLVEQLRAVSMTRVP